MTKILLKLKSILVQKTKTKCKIASKNNTIKTHHQADKHIYYCWLARLDAVSQTGSVFENKNWCQRQPCVSKCSKEFSVDTFPPPPLFGWWSLERCYNSALALSYKRLRTPGLTPRGTSGNCHGKSSSNTVICTVEFNFNYNFSTCLSSCCGSCCDHGNHVNYRERETI